MLGALPYFGHIGPDWLAVGTRDSRRCAHQLGALLRGRDAVVNLIPYNTACAPRPTPAPGPVHICAGTDAHICAGTDAHICAGTPPRVPGLPGSNTLQ
jgi:hypothetical protein